MPCLSLWERWPSIARTERALPHPLGEVAEHSKPEKDLPHPLGEVAEHSEYGEELTSPFVRGGGAQQRRRRTYPTLWERWLNTARPVSALPLPMGEVAEHSEDGEGKS